MLSERVLSDLFLQALPDSPVVLRFLSALKADLPFIYPTETIYGVGGRVNARAQQAIFSAKQRPPENPMILIAASRELFLPFGFIFPAAAQKLADTFWPGNLTLVLPDAQGEFTGIRVTDHPVVKKISALLGEPIYSTSANMSGAPYHNDPDRIYESFADTTAVMIDAGTLPLSPPSAVVKVDGDNRVTIIREGRIDRGMIEAAIGSF